MPTSSAVQHGDRISSEIAASVDAGAFAGAATLIWRNGEILHTAAVGFRELDTRAPLARDTIFRIASMTKPITSLAALMLVEAGKLALDRPIADFAPEFANMQVLGAPNGELTDTVAADRLITFEDLLTHRSGLTYGGLHSGPLASAYVSALGGDLDSGVPPDAWIANLARLPLIDQPGALFHYGRSTDLLGLLIARIEGKPLGEVLRARIFEPLGMKDTSFTVPKMKWERRAAPHGFNAAGQLTQLALPPGKVALAERPADMEYESGGQGLWSTVDDYLTFARIFIERGAVNGVTLLRPETVQRMTSNQLSEQQRARSKMLGMRTFASGHGFGLGLAVVTDPALAAWNPCGGGIGSVGWPGAYGGWWRADPSNHSVLIFLAHNMVALEQLASGIGLGVYEAIDRFQTLARSLGSA